MSAIHFNIALTLVPGLGAITGRKLLDHFGSAQAIFEASTKQLIEIHGIGQEIAKAIKQVDPLKISDDEVSYIDAEGIQAICYTDSSYPTSLKHCRDAPVLLYYKGRELLKPKRSISIIGTRTPSEYGRWVCEQFVEGLAEAGLTVVSGLAYGIDIIAHRKCLELGLPTVGVMANGFNKMYPASHLKTAVKMQANGGILTEFTKDAKADREHFPMRNRIIAGISDAVLVVESASRGGSMITAFQAQSYYKDVFAIPGRINDEKSAGCNLLIGQNIAASVTEPKQIIESMNWDTIPKQGVQQRLFCDLDENETMLLNCFNRKESKSLDEISLESQLESSKIAALLLNLEFKGIVRSMPGKQYMVLQ